MPAAGRVTVLHFENGTAGIYSSSPERGTPHFPERIVDSINLPGERRVRMLHGEGQEQDGPVFELRTKVANNPSSPFATAGGAPAAMTMVGLDRETRAVVGIDHHPRIGPTGIEASKCTGRSVESSESPSDKPPGACPTRVSESDRGRSIYTLSPPGGPFRVVP